MQETWKLAISPSIQYNDLKHLVQELLLENQKEMGIFLSYYYKKEGAVVENVQLIGPIFFSKEKGGDFIVDFELIHFNACLNIHEQNKDKMKVQFEFDQDSNELILIGPYWPEREMDEI
ncbi:hypothetical protein SAMN00777080_3699 [Aquiflexum balticum DSM 16537]|uniref:Uncharacterized protein n=1 Tax=Aquiflexum balticum DSM 16537 TaxID=758820 RepID=A0A1W2H8R6_9BACT|nr:hypothetical protein [Aquiflexum balticum]SMD45058.1 hypothetical protein SAMN00777080_3699 [Aquiflexum balticum DSM 16537]